MAKQDLTRVYSGADLSGATAGIIYLPVVRDSTLEKVSVRSDAAQVGNAVFEVRKNGAVITGLAALTIANGAKVGTVSGLSIALSDGDEIVLNLLSGSVSSPVTFNLGVDDGETAGVGATGGGKLFSIDAKPSSELHPSSDYFDSDLSKWTIFQASNPIQKDGLLQFVETSNGASSVKSRGILQPLPDSDCTIIAKLRDDNPAVSGAYFINSLTLFQDISNPNTTDFLHYSLNRDGTNFSIAVSKYNDYQTYGSFLTDATITEYEYLSSAIYLRASRFETTWTFSYSRNGRKWITLYTYTESSFYRPNGFGVLVDRPATDTLIGVLECEFVFFSDTPNANLPGGSVGNLPNSIITNRIICLGDSITFGKSIAPQQSFPHQLAETLNAVSVHSDNSILSGNDGTQTWKIINRGVDSQRTGQIISASLPNAILRRDTNLTRDIVIVFAGTNDMANDGDSAAAVYGRLTTIINTLQSAGFEVVVCTTIDRDAGLTVSGFDAKRAAYNSLITANGGGADFVVDLYSDARLQNASDTTYFLADQIHPNAAGQSVIAGLIADGIS